MAENELSLINKVELRIALAAEDAQFEKSLGLYLGPILLKLGSPHAEVRQAVLKIIQYLIPRISAAKSIRLPIESLLKQVKEPKLAAGCDPSLVRLYTLVFVSRGIDRLSVVEQRDLALEIIAGIHGYSRSVSARLLNIFFKLVQVWESSNTGANDGENIDKQEVVLDPEDEKFLSHWFAKFFLLYPTDSENIVPMAGLSKDDISFFTKQAGTTFSSAQEIGTVKTNLLEFMKNGFKDESIAIPLLIASCDDSSSIADPSTIRFKKLNVSYENESFTDAIIELYLGTRGTPPVKPVLQDSILNILSKSDLAAKSNRISEIASTGLSSEYLKLNKTAIYFIRSVAAKGSVTTLDSTSDSSFSLKMASEIKNGIISDGWPKLHSNSSRNNHAFLKHRQLQYEVLGTILRSNPNLYLDDFTYIEFLLESLKGEDSEMRSSIQDALSGLTSHVTNLSTSSRQKLKVLARTLLLEGHECNSENLKAVKFVIIKFIITAFPFKDSEARFLCILGTASINRSDSIEEALKGLHPYWFGLSQSANSGERNAAMASLKNKSLVEFPPFSEMVETFTNELNRTNEFKEPTINLCLGEAVKFCFYTLVMNAVQRKETVILADEVWIERLEKALDVDEVVQQSLKNEIDRLSANDDFMEDDSKTNVITTFVTLTLSFLTRQYGDNITILKDAVFGYASVKIISLSSSKIIETLYGLVDSLLAVFSRKTVQEHVMLQVAKCFGIIVSGHNDRDYIEKLFEKIVLEVNLFNQAYQWLLPASCLCSRLEARGRLSWLDENQMETLLAKTLDALTNIRSRKVASECISQLAIFGVFKRYTNASDTNYVKKLEAEVASNVKRGDETSVLVLSYLSLCDSESRTAEGLSSIEETIYNTYDTKRAEFLFTAGESLSVLASGWDSKFLQVQKDIQEIDLSYMKVCSRISILLQKVLHACQQTSPRLRKAGCIWLLSLVQYCGHLELIKKNSSAIHVAFMRFLADRDELVQESASRGLSIIYELGDFDLKDTLLKSLLKSFGDNNASAALAAGSVDLETELFEPDLLKTNEGSVSTYKDVLNLASDVGDPGLVYKFMSLAKSSALWSSRKGMAFGLGSILSKASLDKTLSSNKSLADRLIPKLYRYRYDPNSSVSKVMTDIWNSLVPDQSQTIKENFEVILKDLLKEMSSKEWRVRQASASALRDLLQLAPIDMYEDHLENVWNMSFRVMDDIKESVRKEGLDLTKSLAFSFVRSTSSNTSTVTERSERILTKLLPFFLGPRGLLSDAEEVRAFALKTVLDLCKSGGSSIKPFIPDLMEQFVLFMSSLEPEAVNYLVLNADKYNLKSNDIDSERLRSLGQSPMMDAIEKLLDHTDEQSIDEVVSKVTQAIKKSVGLPSKVCGSRVVVSLVTKHSALVSNHTERLVTVCLSQIKDRNDSIASSYAIALGYLCRYSSTDAISRLSRIIIELYFESEDERNRKIAAVASESISKYSGDRFETLGAAFLPLAFIGKHDNNTEASSFFDREWVENTAGRSAVKLYAEEITNICEKYLQSNSYEMRRIIGKALVTFSASLDENTHLDSATEGKLFDMLIGACKGKSWQGKELMLESLVSVSIKFNNFVQNDQQIRNNVDKVVSVEAKRRNKEYQRHSIKLLGIYLQKFNSDDLEDTYIEVMEDIITLDHLLDDEGDDPMEDVVPAGPKHKQEEEQLLFLINFYEANTDQRSDKFRKSLLKATLHYMTESSDITWRSKSKVSECLSDFSKNLFSESKQMSKIDDDLYGIWIILERSCSGDENIEAVKIQFIRASGSLLAYLERAQTEAYCIHIKETLNRMKTSEKSTIVLGEIERVLR